MIFHLASKLVNCHETVPEKKAVKLSLFRCGGPLDLNWGIYGPGGTLPSNKCLDRKDCNVEMTGSLCQML